MRQQTLRLKAFFLVIVFLGVAVLARPSEEFDSEESGDDGFVTNVSFLRDLFTELDRDGDGMVSKPEIANLVRKLAGEEPFNEDDVIDNMPEYLDFKDFTKEVKHMAYPAFNPMKSDRPLRKADRNPSEDELRALEEFSTRMHASVRRGNKAQVIRRTHIRPLHPMQIFDVYKVIRDQDHVEDLFDEADMNKDNEVRIYEAATLMKAYKVKVSNSEILQYFLRVMDTRGVITTFSEFRVFLESVARSCHHHVTGEFIINKSLRDRCYVQQCLIENEKYRTYPEPFSTNDKEELKSEIAYYASFVDTGDSGVRRNFDRLLKSKSFRRNLRNPIYTC